MGPQETPPLRAPEDLRASVLVVEDDPLVANALRLSLIRAGFDVRVGSNVDDALKILDHQSVDVVLTDLVMPGGSGLDLLGEMERRDPTVPVIIITADDSVQAAARAVRERAFDYLTKPVSRDVLTETVRRALEQRHQARLEQHEQERLREEHRALYIRNRRTATVLSVLFDRSTEVIIQFDQHGRLVNASQSFVQLVGRRLIDLLDQDSRDLFERHPTEGDVQELIVRLANASASDGYWRGEVNVFSASGESVPARMSLSVCEVTEGTIVFREVVGLLYYESAYAELSRQLQQADRLASTGLLAGSAAHEIANDLGPLLGYLSLLEGGTPIDRDIIGTMRESVRRIQQHTEQILEPLRPRVRTRGAVLLGEAIRGIIALLRRAGLLRRVRVEIDEGEHDLVVHADKHEVHQILMNLLTNAIDALGDGGGADRGLISIRIRKEGDFARLETKDTGSGISEELKAKIFEPFFTTKGSGGTGLGLPVVRDIVRGLRGDLSFDSSLGHGSLVTVRVPLHRPQQSPL